MIRVKRVDHVGIAVRGLEDVLSFFSLLGIQVSSAEDLPQRGLKMAFLPAGECQMELVESTSPNSPVGKLIEQRGEGLYHICLAVEDIDGAVEELRAAGIQLIDQKPRPAGQGRRVAFIDPDSTRGVLVQLMGD